jgi:3D (Asp-Asp-Asp) domain-containing protein
VILKNKRSTVGRSFESKLSEVLIMRGFLLLTGLVCFLILGTLGLSSIIQGGNLQQDFEFSDGWRITGYFTPLETDYASEKMREIEIKDVGAEKFDTDFLDTVFDEKKGWGEGWGKTRFGWYLGYYDGNWHRSQAPLDAYNQPLQPNSVAVDNSLIPSQSKVKIPALPGKFGQMIFIANDVGVTVHGKHIDVYCGEGKDAERQMDEITFEEDEELVRVYFQKP